jgi:hypothetical protein
MDRKALIKRLNHLFCDLNRAGKKYTEVWLSDVDFGDLYRADKYILNVKAEHAIDACRRDQGNLAHFRSKRPGGVTIHLARCCV